MEYTNIISLVPQGENFDASVVGEGVWLTEPHLNAIETRLTDSAAATTALQETIQTSVQQIQSLTDQLTAANSTITARDATIAAQAAEIASLKAAAAKPLTTTASEGDDLNNGASVAEDEITKENKRIRAARGLDTKF
jgi:Tfp pilus assembly protein FimV